MTTADRRFEIIVVLYHRSDYVKVSTLSDMFAAVDSTIRSDMDYLREHFSIESRSGKDGGYRLIDAPIFFIHAEMLHNVKKTIESKEYLDYVCVNQLGERLSCDYLTGAFPRLLKQNDMRVIRFHDLRHSCASLLLANGVPMKQIQEWMGHSDFATTANIYAHLDYHSKIVSAEALISGLGMKGSLETPAE